MTVSEVKYSLLDAQAPSKSAKKRSRKRRNAVHAAAGGEDAGGLANGGWKMVDTSDMQIEGFEDGCAFDLEELTGA